MNIILTQIPSLTFKVTIPSSETTQLQFKEFITQMLQSFEISVSGPEIIKGNRKLAETKKLVDVVKMLCNPPPCQIVFLLLALWHQSEICPNAVATVKYFIQVYVFMTAFKDIITLYPPFICHSLLISRACLFPTSCNIYKLQCTQRR
jgi:hypothetical protein